MTDKIWNNIERFDDELEHVTKFVFTNNNAVAETVLYRYPTYEERTVICLSVMAGCPIGCRFCGTGDFFIRNLTDDEIFEQARYALEQTGVVSNDIKKLQIMFMSQGEPFLNLHNLEQAIIKLNELYPHAALLVSTSAPRIGEDNFEKFIALSKTYDKIGLQFSIHETTDSARDKLIPFKKKYSLQEISSLGKEWFLATNRKPYFNYCAHQNNTSVEDVSRIVSLFDKDIFCATVSVICERDKDLEQTNEYQRNLALDFGNKLLQEGYDVRVFDPAGQDTIGGGCGQLHYVQEWAKNNQDLVKPSVGYGNDLFHCPIKV